MLTTDVRAKLPVGALSASLVCGDAEGAHSEREGRQHRCYLYLAAVMN